MSLLGYVILGVNESNGGLTRMSIIGNVGDPTVYGLTKTKISIIKADGISESVVDTNKVSVQSGRVSGKIANNTHHKLNIKEAKKVGARLLKIRPRRSSSALAIAHGLNIELGRSMAELIEMVKATESLYLINKIREKNGRVLWGITRMGAGSVPSFEIGSVLEYKDKMVRFTPNCELRKSNQYRAIVPLTTLNMLSIRTDFKSAGYISRYNQIMAVIARPMKWAITGVIENSDTSVYIKVRNEVGEYKYYFTLDKDNTEFLRLTDVALVQDLLK